MLKNNSKHNKTSKYSNQKEGCMSYKNNLKHNKTSAKEYNTPSSTNQEVNLFKDFDQNSQDLNSFSLSDIVSKNIKSSQFLDGKEQSVIEDCYKQDHNVSEQKEADLSKASELNTQSTDYEDYMPKNNNDFIKELNPDFIAEIDKRVCEQMEKEKGLDLKPNESTISMLSELGIQEKPEEDPYKEMRIEEHPPLRTEEHPTEQYISNNTYDSIYKDVDNSEQENLNESSDNNLGNREFNSERLAGGKVHSINKSNRDNKKGQTKFITEYMYLPTSRRKHKLTHVTNPYKKGYLGEGYLSYTENIDRRMWQEINHMAGRNFCYNSKNRINKSILAQKIKNNKPLPIFNDLLSLKKYLAAILKSEKRQEQAVNDNLHWAPTSLIKFWEQEQLI